MGDETSLVLPKYMTILQLYTYWSTRDQELAASIPDWLYLDPESLMGLEVTLKQREVLSAEGKCSPRDFLDELRVNLVIGRITVTHEKYSGPMTPGPMIPIPPSIWARYKPWLANGGVAVPSSLPEALYDTPESSGALARDCKQFSKRTMNVIRNSGEIIWYLRFVRDRALRLWPTTTNVVPPISTTKHGKKIPTRCFPSKT
jgi:hypothetical protein